MPLHNELASTLSLASVLRSGVDPKSQTTSVPTASLILILDTLLGLGFPSHQERMSETASKTLVGIVAAFNSAGEQRGS